MSLGSSKLSTVKPGKQKVIFTFSVFGALMFIFLLSVSPLAAAFAPSLGNQFFASGPPPGWTADPPIHFRPYATTSPSGLSPAEISHAYGFDQLSCYGSSTCGSGQTIAIVDAYDDPNVASDLNTFSFQFGLPLCNSANPCFVEHKMASSIRTNQGWAVEISLDVQWAHAIAPKATILLVEAKSNSLSNLLAAVKYAKQHTGVHQVSMSWGGSEFSSESSYNSYFQQSGVSFFASSGDSGHGVSWPAASTDVVSVGGTTLNLGSSGNVVSETAWSGSGGGTSAYISEPSYQTNLQGPAQGSSGPNANNPNSKRGVPDVSYDADPYTGVSVYDSFGYQGQYGWFVVGGTSAGSPQWAALTAIVNSARISPLSTTSSSYGTANDIYGAASSAYSTDYRDISSGSNGACAAVCTSGTGYDFVTGLGSPLANNLIAYLQTHG